MSVYLCVVSGEDAASTMRSLNKILNCLNTLKTHFKSNTHQYLAYANETFQYFNIR